MDTAVFASDGVCDFNPSRRAVLYEADWRLAASAGKDIRVDPAFWAVRLTFGVAGGPDIHDLTVAGAERAFCIGARVDVKGARALMALAVYGGARPLEQRVPNTAKIRLTQIARDHEHLTWLNLKWGGFVDITMTDQITSVALTVKGRDAIIFGHDEEVRLLARVRVAHSDVLTRN